MSGDKAALRITMRELAQIRRDATALSASLAQQLRDPPLWRSSGAIAAFSALDGEPDVLDPWPQDKRIALPRVAGAELTFHWIVRPAELQPGRFGVLEPAAEAPGAGSEFDLILIPGMAFDLRGGRLGRGRGYYDRFLAGARGLRLGVCFEDQIVEAVPSEAHDLRMDFVVTPSAIYRCAS
jgi:5-formyltetrahydrofolate cyclo-ligase